MEMSHNMEHHDTNQVELRAVRTLLGKRYYVPSYQRGYRWTAKQVRELLEDLFEFSNSGPKGGFYCLQPLVVVPLLGEQRPKAWQDGDKLVYEVVDGQQRLTTLFLILQFLKSKQLPLDELYELSYETRPESADFLTNIQTKSKEESECNSDYWHIYHAYKTIEDWFDKDKEKENCIYKLLISRDEDKNENVRVIWYELGQSEDKIAVFSRLNIGKIPLTNAELIKALFLRRGNFAESLATVEQVQLASEWDSIEHKLQNPSFWSFVSKEPNDMHNRIELIFKLIAGGERNEKDTFKYYTEELNTPNAPISKVWLKVKQVFLRFEEWYEDHKLYHYVGYLTNTDSDIDEIYKLSLGKSKKQFVDALKKKIKDNFRNVALKDIEYGKTNIRKVLLLFNIETLLSSRNADTRFPFNLYQSRQWDVEHIRSQTEYRDKSYQEVVLKESVEYFESKPQREEVEQDLLDKSRTLIARMSNKQKGDAFQKDFDELFAQIQKHFGEDEDLANVNGLGNLTLLDSKTNRSYGNSPFVLKRQRIIKNDRKGVFTPIATKNVFLKYYSHHATDILVWQDKDAEDYMQSMQELLSYYFSNE